MNQVRMVINGIGGIGKKYAMILDKGLVKDMTLVIRDNTFWIFGCGRTNKTIQFPIDAREYEKQLEMKMREEI